MTSATGTTGWSTKSMKFTSGATAVKAYFGMLRSYNGYGTAWLDDVQMVDVFGGRVPVAFGGTVTSDSGGMTQTASASGLSLSARYTSVGDGDSGGCDADGHDGAGPADRGVVPAAAGRGGMDVGQDFVTPMAIQDGVRYEN